MKDGFFTVSEKIFFDEFDVSNIHVFRARLYDSLTLTLSLSVPLPHLCIGSPARARTAAVCAGAAVYRAVRGVWRLFARGTSFFAGNVSQKVS